MPKVCVTGASGCFTKTDRIFLSAGEYKPYDLGVDYRLTTDGDLLERPLHRAFCLPDGTRREILQFAV